MKNFSWNVFAVTGNIEAYLLYKECNGEECHEDEEEEIEQEENVLH